MDFFRLTFNKARVAFAEGGDVTFSCWETHPPQAGACQSVWMVTWSEPQTEGQRWGQLWKWFFCCCWKKSKLGPWSCLLPEKAWLHLKLSTAGRNLVIAGSCDHMQRGPMTIILPLTSLLAPPQPAGPFWLHLLQVNWSSDSQKPHPLLHGLRRSWCVPSPPTQQPCKPQHNSFPLGPDAADY